MVPMLPKLSLQSVEISNSRGSAKAKFQNFPGAAPLDPAWGGLQRPPRPPS